MDKKYDDIINISNYKSKKRKPMDTYMRAAQFAPFSALTGYEESIYETGRETKRKIILDDNQKDEINYKLAYLLDFPDEGIMASVTHFVPDKSKSGGEYVTTCDCVYKYDSIKKLIVTRNGTEIYIDDIISIKY